MAFPVTGVLDNFDRADSASLGPNWTTPVYPGVQSPRIVSNQMGGFDDGTGFSDAWWNVSTFGPDQEVFHTVATRGTADLDLYARISAGGTSGVDAYDLFIFSSNWQFYVMVNASSVPIGSSVVRAISSGDSIGMSVIGNTLRAYYKAAAGAWTQILTTTDSTLSAPGYIGASANRNNVRIDNFGGGTILSAADRSSPFPPMIGGWGA